MEEIKNENMKNEIEIIEKPISINMYTDDKLDILKGSELINPDDINYLLEHKEEFQERFIKRSFFRSKFEMEYAVLSNSEHPTPDSKYWQAIGEQAVHVQEVLSLDFEYKKTMADIEYTQAQIEDLEYQLNQDFEHDFDRKKIEAKLKKKCIQLKEKEFSLVLQKKTAKERIKEIKNWTDIIKELEPQVKYGFDDFEKHHAERYIMRYGQRLQNLNLLKPEDREHVIKNFISFAQAPENQEMARKYLPDGIQLPGLPKTENQKQIEEDLKEIGLNESNFSSKDEMMEKDPVTQNFFNRRIRRILVATPHRTDPKENVIDRNVTNFHLLQVPAAFDVQIEEPFGLSVSDARNFIINKAIKEEYDYIFFVDDDVLIPRNTLVKLMYHKTDIVGGFYYRKYFPLESVGMHVDKDDYPVPIENFEIGDLIHNTLVLPSGITLIKTKIFKEMDPPWYKTCSVKNRISITEDTYVCQRIRDLGYDIITDTGIQGIHIDKMTGVLYGHPEIVNADKNQVYQQWRDHFAI